MLFQILKKDLMKRKGVNIILFLFMTLATVFLSSSVNNIMVVGSAVNYYMDYANVPDVNVVATSDDEKDLIDAFIEDKKAIGEITEADYNNFLVLTDKNVLKNQDEAINTKGTSLYLSTQDIDYVKVFDEEGKPFTLADDEIALTSVFLEKNDLDVGDTMSIRIGDVKKEFKIKTIMKDAAFGSEMVGMSRFVVSQNVYDELSKDATKLSLYYIMTPDPNALIQDINSQDYASVMNTITKDLYMMIYSFDMIFAALLILIGICLILIALLVLRFTLIFTMEEQYYEIGVLKAIGLRNSAIKRLYLVKYLVIVTLGACLGLLLSFPISDIMVQSVSQNMIMESSSANLIVNVLCAAFVVIMVLGFCYLCTRKLNKVSAITAIHGGADGERFHKLRGIHLSKRKHMRISLYLGSNDILCSFRRFLILVITFSISFILITIPLNTINTMRSNEMVRKFLLNPDSAVYVRNIELENEEKYNKGYQIETAMDRITNELEDKGYEDVALTGISIYFLSMSDSSSSESKRIMSVQVMGANVDYPAYEEGTAPTLENEIAISKGLMKENGWSIGNSVDVTIDGVKRSMIITATYSDYMQLGKSARLNPKVDCGNELLFDYWNVNVDMKSDKSQIDLASSLQQEFTQYEWADAQKLVDQNVGGIQNVLESSLLPMTAMLCVVIMLITLLMEKLFITREKGQIAMLKSIGVSMSTIRNWQLSRMILVVLSSMLISIPLSFLSNQFMLKPIFSIMGADVAIQVNTLDVYVIYPGILLIGIIIATYIAVRSVKRIDIRDLNNLE